MRPCCKVVPYCTLLWRVLTCQRAVFPGVAALAASSSTDAQTVLARDPRLQAYTKATPLWLPPRVGEVFLRFPALASSWSSPLHRCIVQSIAPLPLHDSLVDSALRLLPPLLLTRLVDARGAGSDTVDTKAESAIGLLPPASTGYVAVTATKASGTTSKAPPSRSYSDEDLWRLFCVHRRLYYLRLEQVLWKRRDALTLASAKRARRRSSFSMPGTSAEAMQRSVYDTGSTLSSGSVGSVPSRDSGVGVGPSIASANAAGGGGDEDRVQERRRIKEEVARRERERARRLRITEEMRLLAATLQDLERGVAAVDVAVAQERVHWLFERCGITPDHVSCVRTRPLALTACCVKGCCGHHNSRARLMRVPNYRDVLKQLSLSAGSSLYEDGVAVGGVAGAAVGDAAAAGVPLWPTRVDVQQADVLGAVDGECWADAQQGVEATRMAAEDDRAVQWRERERMWLQDVRRRDRWTPDRRKMVQRERAMLTADDAALSARLDAEAAQRNKAFVLQRAATLRKDEGAVRGATQERRRVVARVVGDSDDDDDSGDVFSPKPLRSDVGAGKASQAGAGAGGIVATTADAMLLGHGYWGVAHPVPRHSGATAASAQRESRRQLALTQLHDDHAAEDAQTTRRRTFRKQLGDALAARLRGDGSAHAAHRRSAVLQRARRLWIQERIVRRGAVAWASQQAASREVAKRDAEIVFLRTHPLQHSVVESDRATRATLARASYEREVARLETLGGEPLTQSLAALGELASRVDEPPTAPLAATLTALPLAAAPSRPPRSTATKALHVRRGDECADYFLQAFTEAFPVAVQARFAAATAALLHDMRRESMLAAPSVMHSAPEQRLGPFQCITCNNIVVCRSCARHCHRCQACRCGACVALVVLTHIHCALIFVAHVVSITECDRIVTRCSCRLPLWSSSAGPTASCRCPRTVASPSRSCTPSCRRRSVSACTTATVQLVLQGQVGSQRAPPPILQVATGSGVPTARACFCAAVEPRRAVVASLRCSRTTPRSPTTMQPPQSTVPLRQRAVVGAMTVPTSAWRQTARVPSRVPALPVAVGRMPSSSTPATTALCTQKPRSVIDVQPAAVQRKPPRWRRGAQRSRPRRATSSRCCTR